MLTEHEEEIKDAIRKQGHDLGPEIEYRFKRDRQRLLGLAAATITIEAERQRAYEIAVDQTVKSLALLRCLNPLNGLPFYVSYSLPLGREHVPSYDYFFVEDGKMKGSTSGTNFNQLGEWRIDDVFLSEIKSLGFDALSSLLKGKRSPFQEDFLSNLLLYSQSCLRANLGDRLAYIITPLEGLLRSSIAEPVQALMERFAIFVGQSVEERRHSVTVLEKIYGIQLNHLHDAPDSTQEELLKEFFSMAWTFFINVIPQSGKYHTKAAFLDAIDNTLLSGGLHEV
jgi:hypothetical protein